MLKLWGRVNSLNVQKVLLCLDELGLPYQRKDAGLEFGIVDTPDYKALNPNSRVPTIEDNGFVLWESNVIVRYLCAKYAESGLWLSDLQARADADRWMDWQQTTFNPAMTPIFLGLVRKPGAVDAKEIEKMRLATERNAAILEARLAQVPFISGAAFGMADLVLAPPLHRWLNLPVARVPRPSVERWYAQVRERPSARKFLTLPIT
jgi:glutathione S-transferase